MFGPTYSDVNRAIAAANEQVVTLYLLLSRRGITFSNDEVAAARLQATSIVEQTMAAKRDENQSDEARASRFFDDLLGGGLE